MSVARFSHVIVAHLLVVASGVRTSTWEDAALGDYHFLDTSSDEDFAGHIMHLEEEHLNMTFGNHMEGLEEEHLNMTSYKWPVYDQDREIIKDLLLRLNTPSENVSNSFEWKWEESDDGWTFPLLEKTAQDLPIGALAQHMLHRHGMAPFAASLHGAKFAEFFSDQGGQIGSSVQDVHSFVEIQEAFTWSLYNTMRQMSLSALRNMHSHDHSDSVRVGKGTGCSGSYSHHTRGPHMCILQAGFSKRTHDFMEHYGFSNSVVPELKGKKSDFFNEVRSCGRGCQKFKKEHRLDLWAGEQGDLFELYDPRYAK